jgi:hypothetical protein
MKSHHWIVAVVFVCIVPGIASAQRGVGTIAGVVKDATGAVIPGVTVEVASPALIEKVRSVVTDGAGQYRVVDLVPGVYDVIFSLQGFATIRRSGIELVAGFTATVSADLRLGELEETVLVEGHSPVVDVQSAVQQRTVSREVLDTIPRANLYSNITSLTPGITMGGANQIRQDVGGSAGQSWVQVGIHGGRQGDQQVQLDGMSLSLLRTVGTPTLIPQDASIEEYQIELAARGAESETGGIRINMVPKEGGNVFRGTFIFNGTNERFQANNVSDELRRQGLRDPNSVKSMYVMNAGVGGPLVRDKIWLYTAWQKTNTESYIAGMYFNQTPGTPFYTPDFERRAVDLQPGWGANARLTWQANDKNKFSFYYDYADVCSCNYFLSATRSPEASWIASFINNLVQVRWTHAASNKLLFEVGNSSYYIHYSDSPQKYAGNQPMVELSSGLNYNAMSLSTWSYDDHYSTLHNTRASATYYTGTHSMKVGMDLRIANMRSLYMSPTGVVYRMLNQVPNSLLYLSTPYQTNTWILPNLGLFAQDQWTINRLTTSLGVRFDTFKTSYPDQGVIAGPFVPERSAPASGVLNWTDINPRLTASYDLFGNGRTALKATLGRYPLQEGANRTESNIPYIAALNTNVRQWRDLNGDYEPQGDPLNPEANGELGPSTNRNFGKPVASVQYDKYLLEGFGHRPYNWEASAGIQHELIPRVGISAMYFRRSFGNFQLTDNLAVGPEDYDPFCITAPSDPRLPSGGGQRICGLYDLNPSKLGQVDNLITLSSKYGQQEEVYNGVDLTVNARMRNGVLLQGGMSTGTTTTDSCDAGLKPDNPSVLYCHVETPFLTSVKFLASYALPWGIQVAGTYQNEPGPQITANYIAGNAQIAPSLGRNLASGPNGTVTVNVVPPGTLYGKRMQQLDIRFAKLLSIGKTKTRASLDFYNALNGNAPLAVNSSYGTNGAPWQVPLNILPARLIKFAMLVNF